MQRYEKAQEHVVPTHPEFSKPNDVLSHIGRGIRDRYDALRPRSDMKNWR